MIIRYLILGAILTLSVPSFADSDETATIQQKQEIEEVFPTGPYPEKTFFPEEGPDGEQAQRKARKNELDLTKEKIQQKQQGK